MAVFTFIGASIFGAGTFLAGATAFVLKTIAGVGLNLLAQAIAGKPKAPVFSIQSEIRAGGDVPRSMILGKYMTAGSRVWFNTWGQAGKTPNAYFTDVIALSDMPCKGLLSVWVNNEAVTLLTGEPHSSYGVPVSQYRKNGADHLWIKFYDGSQTAADPFLTGTVASTDFPYESTRVGVGVTYAIVTALINQDLHKDIPQCKFVIDGARLYDPSKDTTVGGSGSHRFNNPATWGGDGDDFPVVQIYNIARGIRFAGQWQYGLQTIGAGRLPAADWIAQIAKCRAVVNTPGATTEARFRSAMELNFSGQIADAIEELLTACGGQMPYDGVAYRLICGEPDSPVAAITDADVIATEEDSFELFRTLSDTVNGITATFPDPAAAWEQDDLPPLLRPDLETLDGSRRLLTDFQFNTVPYFFQCQRLMDAALKEARRERRHSLTLPPSFYLVRPGQTLEYSSVENGYENKLFRVTARSRQPNLDFLFDILEIDPADYDYEPGDYRLPLPVQVGVSRPPPQPIVDWAAFATHQVNALGHKTPGILLQWDGQQFDVNRVIYEIRYAGQTVPFFTGSVENFARGAIIITQSLTPVTAYEIRGRYDSNSGRDFAWSSWLSVTTLELRFVASDIGDGEINAVKLAADAATEALRTELGSIINSVVEFTGRERDTNGLRRLIGGTSATIQETKKTLETADSALAVSISTVAAQVDVNTDGIADNAAAVIQEAAARADGDSALAGTISTVSAQVETNIADIEDLQVTKVDADGATAIAQTVLDATFGAGSANVKMRLAAIATPSGYDALFQIQASVTGNVGTFKSTGMLIGVITVSGVQIGLIEFIADRLLVRRPSDNQVVLGWDSLNEVLSIFGGTFEAGLIRSQDGRFTIDLVNKLLTIRDASNNIVLRMGYY